MLIPVDLVILAIPVALYFKMAYGSPSRKLEVNGDYTSRLQKLLSSTESYIPDVCTSDFIFQKSYASTTDGSNWKIIVNHNAASNLSEDELDAAMLQTYYNRKFNTSIKELFVMIGMFVVLIDLVLSYGFLINVSKPPLSDYLLIPMAILVIMIPVSIRIFPSLVSGMASKSDIMALKIIGNADTVKSLIRKEFHMIAPLRPMTAKQEEKLTKNLEKMANRRIAIIDKYLNMERIS